MHQFTRPLDMRYDVKQQSFKISEPSHKVPITCMFLCQFDVKRGNVLMWSKNSSSVPNVSLKNIEFKSIPSGIHQVQKDVVSFIIPKHNNFDEVYYGLSCFEQNGLSLSGDTDHVDRSEVQMFSLGVVVDANFRYRGVSKSKFYDWKPNQFISATEYIDDIQDLLSHWLRRFSSFSSQTGSDSIYADYDLFETYFESNCVKSDTPSLSSPVLRRSWQNSSNFTGTSNSLREKSPHMLESLTQWFNYLGPLIFPLWKASLLQERILIIVGNGVSFEKCNSLVYCLSILALTPHSLSDHFKQEPLQPLYTIGITDMDALAQHVSKAMAENRDDYKIPGFVACTADEILEYRTELYDVCLKINGSESLPEIRMSDEATIKATPHELELYEKLVNSHLGYQLSHEEKEKLSRLIEPTTWSQYFIDGFYWWATAGYMKPSYHEPEEELETELDRDNLEIVLSLVGYFHGRISLLYESLKEVVETCDEEIVTVSPVFLSAISFDCFSARDYDFLDCICRKWFNKPLQVKSVDCRIIC
ncbi:LANO_0D04192g1_1 [Lachancea nothofagi CBS 11611]|uniref:LANO_0D04192g1_1 n=1 Tax=Lachancea nothofagi CBS 11611 TaxID=1266666 RepID=A0A1G4JFY1_9SACH|nr:LANO_0D04192g1_1 [Lachancea nothofagi CBS 11611]